MQTEMNVVRCSPADTVRIERECSECNGRGWELFGVDSARIQCPNCYGTGTLAVDVPVEAILAMERVLRLLWKSNGSTPQAALIALANVLEGKK